MRPQDFVVNDFVKNARQMSRRGFEFENTEHNILCFGTRKREEQREPRNFQHKVSPIIAIMIILGH